MEVLLGSIKGKNDALIRKIENLIKEHHEVMKLEKIVYAHSGMINTTLLNKLNRKAISVDNKFNKITEEVENRVRLSDKDYDYFLHATLDEVLKVYIKKLK